MKKKLEKSLKIMSAFLTMAIFACFCLCTYAEDNAYCSEHKLRYTVIDPSCTKDGYTFLECENCPFTAKTDIIPSEGHILTAKVVVSPTCTKEGYTEGKCAVCGETVYTDIVAPLSHNLIKENTVSPSCETQGYTTYKCTDCGYCTMSDFTDAVGHIYGETFTVTAADCENDGTGKCLCERCGDEKTITLYAKGHSLVTEIKAPTCTEVGYTSSKCKNCGKAYESDYVPAIGHNISGGETVDADCINDGFVNAVYCSVCREIFSADKIIPAKGHTEVVDCGTEPTCTKSGISAGKHCSVCGMVTVLQEIISPLNHSFRETKINPTCTENGCTLYECTRCGAQYKDDYQEPLGHSFENNGEYCDICGELNKDYTDAVSFPDDTNVISEIFVLTKASSVVSEPEISADLTNGIGSNSIETPGVSTSQQLAVSESKTTFQTTKKVSSPKNAVKVKGEWINKKQKNTKFKKLKAGKKSFSVSWSKISSVTGYQIQYSTSSKFTSKTTKSKTISKNKTTSSTIKSLKSKKKYYVRIRTYKNTKLNGKTVKVYSSWSKSKAVKTK